MMSDDMDIVSLLSTCGICNARLGLDVGVCPLCSRPLCGRHLIVDKGVGVCVDCQPRRLDIEALSPVSAEDEARVVALMARDLRATGHADVAGIAQSTAASRRLWDEGHGSFEAGVVEEVQQRMHDEHIDTTWPTCPHHGTHPLWYVDGWWTCGTAGRVAPLGGLDAGSEPDSAG